MKENVLLPVKDADFQSHTTWEYVMFYQSRGAAEFNCLFHTFFTHLVHNVSMNFVWQRKRRFKMFNLIFELFYSTAFLSKNCTWSTTISLITIWVTYDSFAEIKPFGNPDFFHLYQEIGIYILWWLYLQGNRSN